MRQTVMDASARIAEALAGGGHTGYREKFYLYGFVGILDEWVERGFAETTEEVAMMLGGLFAPR
ncbi:MAG: TetR-like C-terminal domain-containing protein [Acidobacteriota bacterium]|nr:TetR-like C-terminal domain-containing protein [Acidobacteriota bacterium]